MGPIPVPYLQQIMAAGGSVPLQPETSAFITRLTGLGETVTPSDKADLNTVILLLKTTMGIDGVTSYWNSLDLLNLSGPTPASEAGNWYKQNIIQNLYNGTTVGVTDGSNYVAYQGYKGNGTTFRISTGYNPGGAGTFKYLQNSGSIGFCSLTDEAGTMHDISAIATGGALGTYILPRKPATSDSSNHYGMFGGVNVTFPGGNIWRSSVSSIGIHEVRKTASGASSLWLNGVRVTSSTGLTNSLTNLEFAEFCASVNGVFSVFSNKRHSFKWAGSGNIDSNVLNGIIQKYWFSKRVSSNNYLGNRVMFIGDSMTGDPANYALSFVSEVAVKTLSNLGSLWTGVQVGTASQQIGATEYGPTSMQTESAIFSLSRNSNLAKDIVVIRAGTNDLAGNSATTGATVYSRLVTLCNVYKSAGFKVIVIGMIARNGGFLNSQSAGGFATELTAFNTLMRADFTGSTAVTNVKSPANGVTYADLYIDLNADVHYQDATNLTYYQADTIHQSLVGCDDVATTYLTPAIQLL